MASCWSGSRSGPVPTRMAVAARPEHLVGEAQGLQEDVDAFRGPQFADIEEVGRIGCGRDRHELIRSHPVVNDPSLMGGFADERPVTGADIGTLEQQHVRLQAQQGLDHHVAAMGQRTRVVVEAASVRRIGTDRRASAGQKAG